MIELAGRGLLKFLFQADLRSVLLLGLIGLTLVGCQDPVVVKPAAFLRLDFPQPSYYLLLVA